MNKVGKKCLYCGEILHGRADKKFCDDQCRSNYNYQQNRDANNLVRKINLRLKKNRRILEAELGSEKINKIHKNKLTRQGFDFRYFTHILNTNRGNYRFCYEYGYLELEEDKILIVKNMDLIKTD
jgi:predicted nucleic acid-binding Zn ribbon protein